MKDKLKKIYDFLIEILILWVFACSLIVGIVIMKVFTNIGIAALVGATMIVSTDKIISKINGKERE